MTRRHRFVILTMLALIAGGPAARHAAGEPQTLSIPYVRQVPTLDALSHVQAVADAHIAGMAMVDTLTQRTPNDGAPVSERTRVYIGYDADNVYAAFVCFDSSPAAIRGRLVGRDRIPDDDDAVALQLDTFGDRKHAYAFQVSAAGVQRDGIWTESVDSWDFSFDAIWRSDSRRTEFGYVALITIPFSSLRFSRSADQGWGLFVTRRIPRKSESAWWPAYSSRVAGRLTQAAVAAGIRGAASVRSLQLTPYSTAQAATSGDRNTVSAGAAFSRPVAGLDAKWVVRNSYVLDATLNPDFSQVESDEPQVTVNERFEKVFPEKRPFFLENASYFRTPMALMFTRRIVDPQVGLRVTGKQGPYAVAALVADDQAPGGAAGTNRAVLAVGRATRNLWRDAFIGAFVSARTHGANDNRLLSADGRFTVGSNWTGTWQAVTSNSSMNGRLVSAGPAYTASISRSGRSVAYVAEWNDRSAGFVADAGHVPRVDFRSLDQRASYRFRPAGSRLVAWGPDLSVARVWDRHGARLDSMVTPKLTFEWTGPVMLALFHTSGQERLRPTEVAALGRPFEADADRSGLDVMFGGFERLVWTATASTGAGANLEPLPGREPDPAGALEATLTASARLTRGLTVDATFLTRRLAERASGAVILANHIWRLKTTYQLTRELGIRLILQRDALDTLPSLTPLRPYADVTGDFLVTYLVAPGRALFIGVNRYEQRRAPQSLNLGWQMFAKISYAFQM